MISDTVVILYKVCRFVYTSVSVMLISYLVLSSRTNLIVQSSLSRSYLMLDPPKLRENSCSGSTYKLDEFHVYTYAHDTKRIRVTRDQKHSIQKGS